MLDGILVMDKAFGITSFQMVQEVRKRLKVKKAGHTGTLDPLATGILPICLGRATKIVQFIMACHKVYQGTMLLGVATDTYDAAGKITEQKPFANFLNHLEGRYAECLVHYQDTIKHRLFPSPQDRHLFYSTGSV